MPEEWLIDGYNLLHGIFPSKKGLKTERGALFAKIADFAAAEGHKVLIVLDGKGDEQELEVYCTRLCRVLYSKAVSADTYIERYLYENKTRTRMVVVTRDRAIIDIARGSGAAVVGLEEFMTMLARARNEASETLFKQRVKAHGFHRPFDKKLKHFDD